MTDAHGFTVVQQTVRQGRGKNGIVVEGAPGRSEVDAQDPLGVVVGGRTCPYFIASVIEPQAPSPHTEVHFIDSPPYP